MPYSPETVYSQSKPWQTNEERLVTEALMAATQSVPEEDIRYVRPPLPNVVLFPPRFGYRTNTLGIRDIVNLDSIYAGSHVDWSGSVSGYQGTSFPSLAQY